MKMALSKKIELNNGVIVNHHRVASINNITNVATIIEVQSYTSKEKRDEEKEAIENSKPMNIFIDTKRISIPYDAEMDVVKAYNYLKTLDEFKDSKDV